jgi:hypothetical protein
LDNTEIKKQLDGMINNIKDDLTIDKNNDYNNIVEKPSLGLLEYAKESFKQLKVEFNKKNEEANQEKTKFLN